MADEFLTVDFIEEPSTEIKFEKAKIYSQPIHGPFRKSIPCMHIMFAALCCFFNFTFPGFGTVISAFTVWHRDTSFEYKKSKTTVFFMNLFAGILQFLTFPLIIGYIWSVLWGIIFIQLSSRWYISNITDRTRFFDYWPCSKI